MHASAASHPFYIPHELHESFQYKTIFFLSMSSFHCQYGPISQYFEHYEVVNPHHCLFSVLEVKTVSEWSSNWRRVEGHIHSALCLPIQSVQFPQLGLKVLFELFLSRCPGAAPLTGNAKATEPSPVFGKEYQANARDRLYRPDKL